MSANQHGSARRVVLVLFLAAQFIGLARSFFMSLVGPGFNEIAAAITYGSLLLLPVLWVIYRSSQQGQDGVGSFGAAWITALMAISALSFLLGWHHGYDLREIIQDYAPYPLLCAFVMIGAYKIFWDDLVWLLPTLILSAILINLSAFSGYGDLFQNDIGDRVARGALAYKTQATLVMWGMALLLMRGQRMTFKVIAIVALYFYLTQQILFQKRLGTAEVLIYLGGFFVAMPLLAKTRTTKERVEDAKLISILIFSGILATVVILTFKAEVFFAQFEALLQRFVGLGAGQRKETTGFWAAVFTENERIRIALEMFEDFSAWDWLVGRGMGGYFAIDISLNANDAVRQQQYLMSYLPDVGQFGRRGLEIGWLMPFLKGGVILLGVVCSGIFVALSKVRILSRDPISLAAWTWLAIECLYMVQGGAFIISNSYRLVLLGACVGRCLSVFNHR